MQDVIDTVSERFKSRYFGYVVLAFFGLNWRAIFLLSFTEGTPSERLDAFDCESSFLSLFILPLFIAALVSGISPWIRWVFLWLSKRPIELIDTMEIERESERLRFKEEAEQRRASLAASREQELIDRAKRDDEIESILDEEKQEILREQIRAVRDVRDLPYTARDILKAAVLAQGRVSVIRTLGGGGEVRSGKISFGQQSKQQLEDYLQGLTNLLQEGLIERIKDGGKGQKYELTSSGWEITKML